MENFDGKNSMENIPIDTTFDATNEELESGVQEKKLAPEPYVFSNTEPWNKYDVRKLKFSPLLDYKGLENKNNGKKVKPSFDFFGNDKIEAKANNLCNVGHSAETDIGYNRKGYKASDGQNVAGFDTPLCGLASAMRYLRNKYKGGKSITEIDTGGYQGYYKRNEHITMSALRIIWITNNSKQLHVGTNDVLDLNDSDTLKCFAASIAQRETGSELTEQFVNKAYTLAFPEEQGNKGVLYDYDGNVTYEGGLLNGKEHGQGKKMENGKVYEGKRENGGFTEGECYENGELIATGKREDGELVEGKIYENGKLTATVENGKKTTVEEYVKSINEKIKPIQEKLEKKGGDKYWKGDRGGIEFKWDTTEDRQMIHSWNNDVILGELTEDKIKLAGLDLDLSFEEGIWLANFKNWVKRNYTGQTVVFGRDIINKNFDFDKTLKIGNTMLITRKDLESYISRCSDDNIMEKLTKWLNK